MRKGFGLDFLHLCGCVSVEVDLCNQSKLVLGSGSCLFLEPMRLSGWASLILCVLLNVQSAALDLLAIEWEELVHLASTDSRADGKLESVVEEECVRCASSQMAVERGSSGALVEGEVDRGCGTASRHSGGMLTTGDNLTQSIEIHGRGGESNAGGIEERRLLAESARCDFNASKLQGCSFSVCVLYAATCILCCWIVWPFLLYLPSHKCSSNVGKYSSARVLYVLSYQCSRIPVLVC